MRLLLTPRVPALSAPRRCYLAIAVLAALTACVGRAGPVRGGTDGGPSCARSTLAPSSATDPAIMSGVVVGDYEGEAGLGGFYLQHDSAAVFVSNGQRDDVQVGDRVRVRAAPGRGSAVIAASVTVCGRDRVTPALLTLPLADTTALARLEGQLVRFPQTLVVADLHNLGRFGEVTLAGARVPVAPTEAAAPGAAALAAEASNRLNRIVLDDASLMQNPAEVYGRGGRPLSASNPLRVGDRVANLEGVLTRTPQMAGGPATWRIRPVDARTPVRFEARNERPAKPPMVGGTMRIASFNVLNYFSRFGTACPFGCRGADDAAELERQARKIVAAITALDADVVGVIEVGNDGYGPGSSLADITARLNAAAGAGRYAFIHVDSATGKTNALGTDAIKVALLYQPGRVSPVGRTAVLATPAFVNGGDASERSRPSLLQAFAPRSGGRVVVSVNHFKSKGSACDADGPADGQGFCSTVRTRAARALLDWIATDPTGTGEPRVLVMGDLNAYALEDPITAFRQRAFTDLLAQHARSDGYSYVFDGARGRLDHALASPALAGEVRGAGVWHINADEAPVLDFNTNFKSPRHVTGFYQPDPFRSSDHDPVLIGLQLSGRRPAGP